jgi:hypothetical protein
MSKVVFDISMSLDGFITAANPPDIGSVSKDVPGRPVLRGVYGRGGLVAPRLDKAVPIMQGEGPKSASVGPSCGLRHSGAQAVLDVGRRT